MVVVVLSDGESDEDGVVVSSFSLLIDDDDAGSVELAGLSVDGSTLKQVLTSAIFY